MKLIKNGYKKEEIDEVIEYLIQKNIIDDFSLIERKINYLQRRGWGELKIYKYLIELGLDKNFVKDGIKKYLDHKLEKENIKKFSKRKAEFEKKVRYLINKGFKESLILEVLKEKED
ncbi:MAG: RecX family transcriptional regulator [Caldisericia bacterium]|nr:RecX family transcriptional regulator [Caldisericia bacterium]